MLNSEKVLAAIEQQNLAQADRYLLKALKEDSSAVLLELAEYLEGIGFLPQAKQIYLQIKDDYPESYLNLAQIAAEDGDTEEAFLYLDAVKTDSDYYVNALLVKADLYDMEGLTEVAREKLLEANRLSQESLVIFALAEIEFKLGNYRQAIDEYAKLDNREILELTGLSTYQRIGRCYASLGKFEGAIEFLEKALEIDYDDQTAFELASILYEEADYQKANLYFKQLDTMNPEFDGYEYRYALSLHGEHKTEKALMLIQQGLSKNAFDEQLLLAASQFSYELHDRKQAENYLLKAQEVAEDQEEVLLRLTNLYLEEERFSEIIALAQQDIANVLTRWNIAKAYQALEQLDKALPFYEDLAADLSDNPEFLQDYIYLLQECGDRKRAVYYAEQYLKLVPDDVNMADFLNEE
ncbi:tetratricopeptide repeat protein [Streptococcus chenjunshii]|uniref:Tetratricopeptide repeat protein n=1 Tax=Streptococcus chenjunshii TaxID=2173853 RepID=A0A372KMH7_9STRE|nr:tetratricopeptide repeat protein [Streptococcus chenjunshii]AXQ78413.1 tetratricopeptide repeat protein [Streptococcus chenjunshii]RFU50518.1 tetratricopeptide repeat protein [Streptococcus chenjunshii]RFU52778.1 tetratricopeptide repeat protein [Streptococcus chenjunshii]